jgi:predicted acyl esterase
VSSSSFPRFDRNTNAGGKGGPMNIIVADQTIYHDQEQPSHLVLPVIP